MDLSSAFVPDPSANPCSRPMLGDIMKYSATNNSYWDFKYIRLVNGMLDAIDASEMTDEDKAHWRMSGKVQD